MRWLLKGAVMRTAIGALLLLPNLAAVDGAEWQSKFADRVAETVNVTAIFRQDSKCTPPQDLVRELQANRAKSGSAAGYIFTGSYVEQGSFSFLAGRAVYDASYAPETVRRFQSEGAVFIQRTVKSFDHDRAESLVIHALSGHSVGSISASNKLPNFYPIDVALGVRCASEQTWLEPSRLESAKVIASQDDFVLLEIPDATLAPVSHRWKIHTAAPLSIVGYQRIGKDGFVLCDLVCSNQETIGGLALPHVITMRYMTPSAAGPLIVRTITVNVSSYTVNSSKP